MRTDAYQDLVRRIRHVADAMEYQGPHRDDAPVIAESKIDTKLEYAVEAFARISKDCAALYFTKS